MSNFPIINPLFNPNNFPINNNTIFNNVNPNKNQITNVNEVKRLTKFRI